MSCREHMPSCVVKCLRGLVRDETAMVGQRGLTTLKRSHMWPSPPKRQTHGCWTWAAARLQIRIVVSSEAEAIIHGLSGDVAKSLIPYGRDLSGRRSLSTISRVRHELTPP